jgi:Bacterial regulatory proteins, luxR family
MDTGRSRNAADVLHIHGFPSQNALAAAARGLMFIERYGRVFPSQRDSHLYITPVTTLQYVNDHPEIIDGVRLSPATVRNYLSNAIAKVGARNRLDAIRIASDAGWF